jgi:hypothetical protein
VLPANARACPHPNAPHQDLRIPTPEKSQSLSQEPPTGAKAADENRTRKSNPLAKNPHRSEAADGDRTRDPELGKLVLYQLSYRRDASQILRPRDSPPPSL